MEPVTVTTVALKSVLAALAKPAVTGALSGLKSIRSQLLEAYSERLADYVARQVERHKFLTTIVFGAPKPLEDLYVPLTVQPPETDFDDNGPGPADAITLSRFDKKFIPTNRRILITDTAGMGKSTLMKFLFLQCVRSNFAVPIFVELRHLSQSQGIIELVERELNFGAETTADNRFDKPKVERLLKKGGLVFFLDGYDEIVFRDREAVTKNINDVIASYPDNYFVITSRPETGLPAFAGFKQYVIRPLRKEESIALIRKYDADGERSKRLISRLQGKEFKAVSEYLKNPLLTTLLYRSFEYKQSLPLKKHAFYRQVFDALFDWHDATKDGYNTREKKSKLDGDGFHRILRVIGFISTTTGQIQGDADTVLTWIRTAREYSPGVVFSERDFLEDLTKAVPLFVRDGSDYRWAHKSLAEYFAAQYICNEGKQKQAEIYGAIRDSGQMHRFSNVLDQLYDLDTIAFRTHLIAPLAKAFAEYWERSYRGMPASIAQDTINARKAIAFGTRSVIVIGKLDDFLNVPASVPEAITQLEEQAIQAYIFHTSKQTLSVIESPTPYSAVLEILDQKRDPLVLDQIKRLNLTEHSVRNSPLKGLGRKKRQVFAVTDDADNPLNSKANFLLINTTLARTSIPIIDSEKMIAFAKSCDAELGKIDRLNDQLIGNMKTAPQPLRLPAQ